ncbi:MAG: hypothetical protein HYT79_06965 [Elusimicrobia bacterium]|nr:hypothetical protein [Elusimicrobiota bacterium]
MSFLLSLLTMAMPSGALFTPKNRPYDVSHYAIAMRLDAAAVHFNASQPAGKEIAVTIAYGGQADVQHQGFFKVADPDEPTRPMMFFTHLEPVAARKLFPCNDEPYDKATTETTVEVDPKYDVFSNGRKVADEIVDIKNAGKLRRVRWVQEKPHSTYLVNIVVGKFGELNADVQGAGMSIYTSPSKRERAEFAMDVLKKALPFFENFYGIKYPWNRYAMVGLPGFLWGGMENTTLTTMRDSAMTLEDPTAKIQKFRIASVVTHELAHQWFGNYVTMKWWDDLWLNEAFASYMETVATEDYFGNEFAVVETVLSTWESYFRQEDGPRSHPIVSKELPTPDDAFDSTNYTKGEQVLRMLDFYIGREAFRKGLNEYLTQFALNNATYKDFMAAMENASGLDLQGFVDSWLLARGYPILEVEERWHDSKKKIKLRMKQRPNHAEDTTVFDFRIPVVFHRLTPPEFHEKKIILINRKEWSADFDLLAQPEWITWNPGSVALVKLSRPRTSEEKWSLQALHDPDPIARIQALFALAKTWVSREAEKLEDLTPKAKETLSLALKIDPSPYVRHGLLDKLLTSKWTRYPDDLTPVLLELAKGPAGLPSSDLEGQTLVRARALALLGKSTDQAGRKYLRELLSDQELPLDILSGASSGIAGFSDQESIQALKTALDQHGRRGYPFKKTVLLAFGMVRHPGVLPELERIVKSSDANNEIVGGISWRLMNNEVIKNSAEGAGFVKDFVLHPNSFSEEMKSRWLEILEESRNPAVRPALEAIVQESSSARIKALAKKTLDKNFPR